MANRVNEHGEPLYEIEAIVGIRPAPDGKEAEFEVKWKNYSSIENTWQLHRSFQDQRIVDGYVESLETPDRVSEKEDLFQLEKILQVQKIGVSIIFEIKCKDIEKSTTVESTLMNHLYPQAVIKFYEELLPLPLLAV